LANITLSSGLRTIPSGLTASGQPYSIYLHSALEHNQDLIRNTIQSRPLIQNYYPGSGLSVAHSENCSMSGQMMKQWGRFEHQKGYQFRGKVYAQKKTDNYSDNTEFHIISTPKLVDPKIGFSGLMAQFSGSSSGHCDLVTVTGENNAQYYDFVLRPNPQRSKDFYISLWKKSTNQTNNSEVYVRFLSLWEEPEGV